MAGFPNLLEEDVGVAGFPNLLEEDIAEGDLYKVISVDEEGLDE